MVKTFHDVNDFIRDFILGCNVSQGLSVNAIVRSFAEFNKVDQNWFLPCQALIDNLSQRDDLFTAGTSSPESCLMSSEPCKGPTVQLTSPGCDTLWSRDLANDKITDQEVGSSAYLLDDACIPLFSLSGQQQTRASCMLASWLSTLGHIPCFLIRTWPKVNGPVRAVDRFVASSWWYHCSVVEYDRPISSPFYLRVESVYVWQWTQWNVWL